MSKVERNAPCPCGSGKKYKQCCMKQDAALSASMPVATHSVPSLFASAQKLLQAGQTSEAQTLCQQILFIDPNHPDTLYMLGIIALQAGQNAAAAEHLKKVLALRPDSIDVLINLGLALKNLGQLNDAIQYFNLAISINPGLAEAHNNLGTTLKSQGNLDAAIRCYRTAVELRPNFAAAHSNLGLALGEQGTLSEAEAHCRRAISIEPEIAGAHLNLGKVLQRQGKLDEAISHYTQAVRLKPDFALAYNNLGTAFQEQGRPDIAIDNFQKAVEILPTYADAFSNLGLAFHELGKPDTALEYLQQALSLQPNSSEAHNNLGNTFKNLGLLDLSIQHYYQATLLKPDFVQAYDNLLYALCFHSGLSQKEIFLAAREFETRFGTPLRASWPAHNNSRDPGRRLRIGYVSPDFRKHAVAYFFEPILTNHDKALVEVFCYAHMTREDEVTARLRQMADHWHSTIGLSDSDVANMIHEHQIDILVDLTGHTANNRLMVFARKPAPIQITYLGYPGTTGLSAMDYRITDHYADPEGSDAYYSEKLLRLPGSLWCYRPSADMPESSPLPALSRGHLTFGSFNNFNKIDQSTLELWADLLQTLPTARLMFLTAPEGKARQNLTERFASLGIAAQRLEFHGNLPPVEFHRKFLEVDITLDPVIVNGATTTCESLWMGVPVMSLAGDRFLRRAGLSILSTTGFADFAASTREEYLHLAKHLADNLPLLAELRAGLRKHLHVSPLVDEASFTRNLEEIYRNIWMAWCSS